MKTRYERVDANLVGIWIEAGWRLVCWHVTNDGTSVGLMEPEPEDITTPFRLFDPSDTTEVTAL